MNEEQKKGVLSVFQQIVKENRHREAVEKHCIHEVNPQVLQCMCKDLGLSDDDFYDIWSVSYAIAKGMCKYGYEGLETAYKGQLIIQFEDLR